MDLAKCPHCGEDIGLEDFESDQLRLILAAGALVASAAITGVMLEIPQYEGARNGYDERLREITEKIHQSADDFAEWGNAYDG